MSTAPAKEPEHWLFTTLAGSQGAAASSSVPYIGPEVEAIMEYIPRNADELALSPGQMVQLRDVYRDGWATGVNRATSAFGMIPIDTLDLASLASSLRVPVSSFGTSSSTMKSLSSGSGSWPASNSAVYPGSSSSITPLVRSFDISPRSAGDHSGPNGTFNSSAQMATMGSTSTTRSPGSE
ncbi:hypothetical protein HDU93_003458 [Gonapodya sp. JEL0774]|nr:hypothetical protein HDU93_003458 [Gonapodya sp. JEL0774]